MIEKPKILLMEDEEDVAYLIQYQAEIAGYDLKIESDGAAGLKTFKEFCPKVVIVDLMLPKLSGLEVCKSIKNNASSESIFVIIMSARDQQEDIDAALAVGADEYLTKPFLLKDLFSKLDKYLK